MIATGQYRAELLYRECYRSLPFSTHGEESKSISNDITPISDSNQQTRSQTRHRVRVRPADCRATRLINMTHASRFGIRISSLAQHQLLGEESVSNFSTSVGPKPHE